MGWLYFAVIFILGTLAAVCIAGRAMWLFDIVLSGRSRPMASVYMALFVVFMSKELLGKPLASLLRDPSGGGLSQAFPWSQGFRGPAVVDIALGAMWLAIAVAAPVLEMNRQWMFNLSGVHMSFVVRTLRWILVMAATTAGFWWYVQLTHPKPVVACALLGLSLISTDLIVRQGLAQAMTSYLDKRQLVVDSYKRLSGAPSGNDHTALSRGPKWMVRTRWAVLLVAAGVAGELAVRADAFAQLTTSTGPIVFMMVLGTVFEAIKSPLENRAASQLKRLGR